MSNENNKSNNGSKNGSNNGSKGRNTTTQKKKRSAAAQARRTVKWLAKKEARKAETIARQLAKKEENERKRQRVLNMFPNVMGIVGAQGFMPNIGRVRQTSKTMKSALNTVPLFQNAHRATIYPYGDQTLLNHYLIERQWDKAMQVLNAGVPKRVLNHPLRIIPRQSPLEYTYEHDQLGLFDTLLEKGAEPNIEVRRGAIIKPLITYIIEEFYGPGKFFVELLVEKGANLNKRDSYGYTPLSRAILRQRVDYIDLLINNGADLETPNEFGFTPVLTAISMGDKRTLNKMVAKGIDINKQTGPRGFSPLKHAVTNGQGGILVDVLALNPELDAKDPEGNTALHYAVMVNALEKIALLKTAGANPRIPNNAGRTAINLAQDLEDRGDNRALNLLKD